jgi:hypothetical protein
MSLRHALPLLILLTPASAQTPFPRVEDGAWAPVHRQAQALLTTLRKMDRALPPDVERKLATLLAEDVKDDAAAVARLQELLDPLCLAGISINPESRVKAARGPASAELVVGRSRVVLLKVYNDAGVTHALAVSGAELIAPGKKGERWLEAVIQATRPKKGLSGSRLEYVALRLTAREAGKREATLKFDAGQGTQDLGFRAEVPILFRIRPR